MGKFGNFDSQKYDITIQQNEKYLGVEVIAASTYEGKPVSAKAICRVDDEYNETQGVRLACARCNEKVAARRKKRAEKKLKEAEEILRLAIEHRNKMQKYYSDATCALEIAKTDVSCLLDEM